MTALSAETPSTELRCPFGPRKLLAKIRLRGDGTVRVTEGNLLELSCRDCTHRARRRAFQEGTPEPTRVLHRFDVAGQLVETVEDDQ